MADDRKYFAFNTESMHLEYLVAPMGAKNSPSYLSSLMQLVLRGLPIQHVISYLDDILVSIEYVGNKAVRDADECTGGLVLLNCKPDTAMLDDARRALLEGHCSRGGGIRGTRRC